MQAEEHALAPQRQTRWSSVAMYAALAAGFFVLYVLCKLFLGHPVGEFLYFPALDPLPFAPMRGFTFQQFVLHMARLAFLAPALVFASLALAGAVGPPPPG